jgi:MFS family permease
MSYLSFVDVLGCSLRLNVGTLFWGAVCFKYGPKYAALFGGLCLTMGALIFSFGSDWPCFFAFVLMGFGAGGTIIPAVTVPPQYPAIQGFLFSMVRACFDASSGVTFLFLMLYQNLNISMQTLYISLAIAHLFTTLLLYCFVFSARFVADIESETESKPELETKKTAVELKMIDYMSTVTEDDQSQYSNKLIDFDKYVEENDQFADENRNTTLTISEILKSREFVMITVWSMFYVLTKYFYLTSMNEQIKWITDDNQHKIYLAQQVFSVMLLSGGAIFSFITGLIIDKCGVATALTILGILSLVVAIFSVILIYDLQFLTMLLFVFTRFFFFSLAPLLIAIQFGVENQTIIYGFVMAISGVFN